ncbi:MAG TPA: lytic transglycosylase domain-containing protein [Thermoanaerobaculia bacterium]|jgi:soluble lytic murein transglycosylase-like protein
MNNVIKKYVTMAFGASLALGGVTALDAPQLVRNLRPPEPSAAPLAEVPAMSDQKRVDFFIREVPFGSIIYTAAKRHNVPAELVAAVARAESAFHPSARSQRGAVGVMQLVPRTGRWLGATDLTDPTQNILAGAKYLAYLTDRFGGNEDHVIAAYNAGEGNVRRFGGVPPFSETRDYIQKVQRFQRDLRARMNGQHTEARMGWSAPGSYLRRLDAIRERARPKIDLHWTTPEERRARRQKS